MNKDKFWFRSIGYILAFIFCIITALSVTLIHNSNKNLDPFTTLFFSCFLTILFFNGTQFKKMPHAYIQANKAKKEWLKISLVVAGNWITTFLALGILPPFVFIFCYFNTSALIGTVVESQKEFNLFNILIMMALLLLLLLFIYFGINFHNGKMPILGLVYALFSALFGYLYRRFSVTFSQKTKLNAAQVLAVRFFLLLLIALVGLKWQALFSLHVNDYVIFILITLFTFILPLYCMQKSVLAIGAERFSIFSSLCPAITAILVTLTAQESLTMPTFMLALFFFVISFIKLYLKGTQS